MGIYLNSNELLINFEDLYNDEYFVDKTEIISLLNKRINTNNKYVCITRPRRFGKTSIINMLGSYYTKSIDTKNIFDKLNISKAANYMKNLNKYNVISVSFNDIPDNMESYDDYINNITSKLKSEVIEAFPDKEIDENDSLHRVLQQVEEKFIFIFDEWDYIFNNNLFKDNQNEFLEFLRNLLKDRGYVALAYMTGVLPIKKHSSTSALNMFVEYTFLKDRVFDECFGFTESEVKDLCAKNTEVSFAELQLWFNGYLTAKGTKIYNPRSVSIALNNGYCESYWTNTGAMDEVKKYLKYNTLEVREDVIKMISGEEIDIVIDEEFRAGQEDPKTKEEIYSAMIILGFLSYHDGYLKIPNKELMKEFEKALRDESFGYVAEIIKNSRRMLSATVSGDTETVVKVLHDIHN